MRSKLSILFVSFIFVLGLVACSDDDGGNNNTDVDASVEDDASQEVDADTTEVDANTTEVDADTTEVDAGEDIDAGQAGDDGIGTSCSCTGTGCEQMGIPVPNGGTIEGCDAVPTDWTGAERVCLRSYEGNMANNTYFANGYCSLMAVACEGTAVICNSATMGDHPNMTECPAGYVLIEDTVLVNVMGSEATIQNKNCVKSCTGAGECREDELDPVLDNAATQYECMDKDGVKFCFDPRNLTADYTAAQF